MNDSSHQRRSFKKGHRAMSMIRRIKRVLPVSSRSFHAMHEDLMNAIEANGALLREVRQIKAECETLNRRLDSYEGQTLPILWDLYRKEGESLKEAKLRFFRMLPQAEGVLREHQLKLAELLEGFDSLCKANDIKYFLATGTLLGAIRHGGFVPWDDDIDVGVMHDDVERLIEAVQDDERYDIATVYDQYVFCRQVRFKRAGSDDRKDPFIDLFIYEYSGGEGSEGRAEAKRLRSELMAEFEALGQRFPEKYPLKVYPRPDEDESVTRAIQDVYERYREKARQLGLYCDKQDAISIIWGMENVSYGNPTQIISLEDYSNMEEADFEGSAYPVVGHSEALLAGHYGDWLSVPQDINTHKHYLSLEQD